MCPTTALRHQNRCGQHSNAHQSNRPHFPFLHDRYSKQYAFTDVKTRKVSLSHHLVAGCLLLQGASLIFQVIASTMIYLIDHSTSFLPSDMANSPWRCLALPVFITGDLVR